MSPSVFDRPVVPYIEGEGAGSDMTPVMLKLVEAYRIKRQIQWMEVCAGEKSTQVCAKRLDQNSLPQYQSGQTACRFAC